MKTKIKRHYRSVVSVLLSVCMLVSCMTVGLIATDAAKVTDGSKAVGAKADNEPVGAKADNEPVGAGTPTFKIWEKNNYNATIQEIPLTENNYEEFTVDTNKTYLIQLYEGSNYYLPDFNNSATSCTIGDNDFSYKWFKTTDEDPNAHDMDFAFSNAKNRVKYTSYSSGTQVQITIEKAPENNPTKITAPSECTATVSNGTTTITSNGSESSGSLTQNSTATVTITPTTGKKVTTATLTGGTSQTLNLISNHNGTYSATYTVPSNTTETAITFSDPVDKSSYKVNVVSSDVSEGTVAATVGGVAYDPTVSYPEDTAVTLTATPESGFVFVNWDFKTTADSSDNSATYYVDGADATGDTVTITGSFDVPGYAVKIDNGSWANMKLLKNGYYISTATVADTKTFVMKRTVDDYWADSNAADYWIKPGGSDTVTWVESTNNVYSNHQGGARYIVFNPTTNKVWLSEDAEAHTSTRVMVKKGAVFGSSSSCDNASSFSASATVAGANWTGSFDGGWPATNGGTDYRELHGDFTATEVGKGVKVTVSVTTIGATIKVAGFVVNGESVLSDDITVSGNTYTMTYTVPEYPPEIIEITPVYKQTSGTIRFYVEGVDGDIREKWGDTIYCYAYYGSKDGATYGTNGSYPGQPLLYENGRYFLDLPEKDAANPTKELVGITLNNGAWDDVHAYRYIGASRTDQQKNDWQCQSYDYDDMIKINALENNKVATTPGYVKADIIFELKSKGVKAASDSNLSNTYSANGTGYLNTINPSDFTFEYLTDYYGKHVDVFGNVIDESSAYYNDTTYLLISQGYDQNSVGHFATSWIVYKNVNGTYTRDTTIGTNGYVGTTSESQFLDSGLENQSGWSALKDKGVQVSFEYAVNQKKSNNNTSDGDKDQPATRYDGRWYVSKVLDVKAHVLIEYGRSEHSTFTRDYFQEEDIDYKSASGYDPSKVEGLVTKTKAHFSETPYSTESEKSTAKNADGSSVNKFNFVAEDDTEGKYTFIGWYKYNDKNEAERVSTKKNYSVDVKNSEELIARFIKTPAGSVIISHDLLTGSEGLGTTLNSVSIVESDKSTKVAAVDPNPITSSSTGAAKIDSKAITVDNAFDVGNSYADRDRWVKIVLDTTPNSADFLHFYYDIDKSDTTTLLQDNVAPASSGFTVSVDETNAQATIFVPLSYFFKDESGDKVFDTDKDTLKFYSELEVPEIYVNYKIIYRFPSRSNVIGNAIGQPKYGTLQYTETGTGLISEVLDNNGSIKKSLIMDKVPYEKNFMLGMDWKIDSASPTTPSTENGVTTYSVTVDAQNMSLPTVKVDFLFPYSTHEYKIYNDGIPDGATEKDTSLAGTVYGPEGTPTAFTDYQTRSFTNCLYQSNTVVHAWRQKTVKNENNEDVVVNYQQSFHTHAAESVGDNKFAYWSIRAKDRTNPGTAENPNYVEVARCYELRFNYTLFDDYRVYALYVGNEDANGNTITEVPDKATDVYSTINLLEYSRNHWNNSDHGSYPNREVGDAVWTDFDVAFENGNSLISGSSNTEVGVLIERVQSELDPNYELNPEDASYHDNYQYYVNKYSADKTSWEARAIDYINGTTFSTGKTGPTTVKNSDESYVKNILNKQLTNKNRMEFGFALFVDERGSDSAEISAAKKNGLYRAYTYIRNKDNHTVLCDTPVYFSVQNEANKIR